MNNPPAARLALRVGVTGHRPNGLVGANEDILRFRVREILSQAAEAAREVHRKGARSYSSDPPILRVVSALAEGADCIVAEEALKLGWELQAPLPFPREVYESDFTTEQSRELFRSLLDSEKTSAVFELDGDRGDPAAYEAVGEVIIRQCDFLLAIWDGETSQLRGGTANIVGAATREGILTVRIDARRPHALYYLPPITEESAGAFNFHKLKAYITERLIPPLHQAHRNRYLDERQPRWTGGAIFPIFCSLLAWEVPTTSFRVRDFVEETDQRWRSIVRPHPKFGNVLRQVRTRFLNHYAWADRLAEIYGNAYRSSFLLNYVLAAVAVLSAVCALAFPNMRGTSGTRQILVVLPLLESVTLVTIICITLRGLYARFQDRWIEYRSLAERLRSLILLAPMGESMPAFKIAAYAKNSDPFNSWVIWHFGAIVRETGLISNRFDGGFLTRYRAFMIRYLTDQIKYHRRVATRFANVGANLHIIATVLFFITLLAVFAHFIYSDALWLELLTVGLPACGAAIVGILGQAEFHRVKARSKALADSLREVLASLRSMQGDERGASRTLRAVAQSVAEVTQSELLDWRIVFRERPLTLPG